jgi:hypothetical protein
LGGGAVVASTDGLTSKIMRITLLKMGQQFDDDGGF